MEIKDIILENHMMKSELELAKMKDMAQESTILMLHDTISALLKRCIIITEELVKLKTEQKIVG